MITMSKNNTFETLLGLLVLTIAGLFIFYVYTSQHTVSGNQYTLHANFQKIDGINVGNDVKLSGVKVGTVSAIDVDVKNFQAKLSISIRNDLKIPTDSTLEISSEGLLGGKYVSIVPGGSADNVKPGHSIFQTVSSMSLENLLSKFLTSSGNSSSGSTSKTETSANNEVNTPLKKEEPKSDKIKIKGKKKLPEKKSIKKEKLSTDKKDAAQLINDDLFGSEEPVTLPSVKQKSKKEDATAFTSANEDSVFSDSGTQDNFRDEPSQKPRQKKASKRKSEKYFDGDLSGDTFAGSPDNEDAIDQPSVQPKNMQQDSAKIVEDILNESFGQFATPKKNKSSKNSNDSQDDNEDTITTEEE